MADPLTLGQRRERLEDFGDVEIASCERIDVFRHRAIGNPVEAPRIDTDLAEVMLQAEPRRRHLGDGGKSQPRQISQFEPIDAAPGDEIERVAPDNLAEADDRQAIWLVARLEDAHGAAPGHVDGAIEQSRRRRGRRRLRHERDIHAFTLRKSQCHRRIERRIEDGAEVL